MRVLLNCWLFVFFCIAFVGCLSQITYAMFSLDLTHFVDLTENALCIGFSWLSFAKVGTIVWKRHQISGLVTALHHIFPHTAQQQATFRIATFEQSSKRMATAYASLQMVMIVFFSITPLLGAIVRFALDGGAWSVDFAYHLWYPFDAYQRGVFELVNLFQWCAAYFPAVGIMSTDLLMGGLVSQMCMHFDRIGQQIREYDGSGQRNKSERDNLMALRAHVKYHAQLLRLSDDLDDIFSACVLFNFVSSILIICTLGFLLVMAGQSGYMLKFGLALAVCTGQIFTVCRLGQLMIDAVGFIEIEQKFM